MKEILEKTIIHFLNNNDLLKSDPSHDIYHAKRVLFLSKEIADIEDADLEIIIPSALFHDVINYPKNHAKRLDSSQESAEFAKKFLEKIEYFPKQKINKVYESIKLCSFTKNLKADFIEAKILQDADGLESVGALAIMRTFSSAGVLNREFYNEDDPFCKKRPPDDSKYALDLFYTRLLKIEKRLHTQRAKAIAEKRIIFMKNFLEELEFELNN
jgi:uncharacterized protein